MINKGIFIFIFLLTESFSFSNRDRTEEIKENIPFIRIVPMQMKFNPINHLFDTLMKDPFDDDNEDDIIDQSNEDNDNVNNNVPTINQLNSFNEPTIRKITFMRNNEGSKQTITTYNNDGTETTEVKETFFDGKPDTYVKTTKKTNMNKGRGLAAPIRFFNSIDDILDDLIFNSIFNQGIGGFNFNNKMIEEDDDLESKIEEDLKKADELISMSENELKLEENKLNDTKENNNDDNDKNISSNIKDEDNNNIGISISTEKNSKKDDFSVHDKITIKDRSSRVVNVDPNHSLSVINKNDNDEIVSEANRREERRKMIEEIKKSRKELTLNKFVVKTIKFSLYVIVILLLIITLRSFLRYLNLLPEAKEIKIEVHNQAEVEMLIKNNMNKYN